MSSSTQPWSEILVEGSHGRLKVMGVGTECQPDAKVQIHFLVCAYPCLPSIPFQALPEDDGEAGC